MPNVGPSTSTPVTQPTTASTSNQSTNKLDGDFEKAVGDGTNASGKGGTPAGGIEFFKEDKFEIPDDLLS